jgi:hypothetical protein
MADPIPNLLHVEAAGQQVRVPRDRGDLRDPRDFGSRFSRADAQDREPDSLCSATKGRLRHTVVHSGRTSTRRVIPANSRMPR